MRSTRRRTKKITQQPALCGHRGQGRDEEDKEENQENQDDVCEDEEDNIRKKESHNNQPAANIAGKDVQIVSFIDSSYI